MTGPTVPPSPGEPAPDGVNAAMVAGLAREVHELRRQLKPLAGVPARVDELAKLVTSLATTVEALTARKGPTPAPSWLMAPTHPGTVRELLDGLVEWLRVIYLRYPDAATTLAECWLWHPDIVEELLWLEHAWLAAYQGPAASVGLVGDWHDRLRPGVVARVKAYGRSCSWEKHTSRPGRDKPRSAPAPVPGADQAGTVAGWWATHREDSAPEPVVPVKPPLLRPARGGVA